MITLIAGTAGGAALLAAEVLAARSRRYAKPHFALGPRATPGETPASMLRMVLLGDGSALGVGVNTLEETVGGQLATLVNDAGARVACSCVAVSGSRSADLATQVARAQLGERPDIAIILIGTDDVTHLVRPAEAATALATAVRRLRDEGTAVVVGTCPDLGAARAIAPPLRQIVGWLSRRMGHAQAAAAEAAGATVVDLAEQVGPLFRADPGMLCQDGFHASADGYRVIAYALLPAVLAAADLSPRP